MRTIKKINQDLDRCRGQIAAIYALPEKEQCPITLEGFQRHLKFLLNEKSLLDISVYNGSSIKDITVHGVRVVSIDGQDVPFTSQHLKARSQNALHSTIQDIQTKAIGL